MPALGSPLPTSTVKIRNALILQDFSGESGTIFQREKRFCSRYLRAVEGGGGACAGRLCDPSGSAHRAPGTRATPTPGKWPRHWAGREWHNACRCCGLREHCTGDPVAPAGPALVTSGRWAGSRNANAGDGKARNESARWVRMRARPRRHGRNPAHCAQAPFRIRPPWIAPCLPSA